MLEKVGKYACMVCASVHMHMYIVAKIRKYQKILVLFHEVTVSSVTWPYGQEMGSATILGGEVR